MYGAFSSVSFSDVSDAGSIDSALMSYPGDNILSGKTTHQQSQLNQYSSLQMPSKPQLTQPQRIQYQRSQPQMVQKSVPSAQVVAGSTPRDYSQLMVRPQIRPRPQLYAQPVAYQQLPQSQKLVYAAPRFTTEAAYSPMRSEASEGPTPQKKSRSQIVSGVPSQGFQSPLVPQSCSNSETPIKNEATSDWKPPARQAPSPPSMVKNSTLSQKYDESRIVFCSSASDLQNVKSATSVSTTATKQPVKTTDHSEASKQLKEDEALFPSLPDDDDIDLEDIVFDGHYYFNQYADVRAECRLDQPKLRKHWMSKGIDQGRTCSPVLDLSYFITKIPAQYQTRQLNYRVSYQFFLRHIGDRLPSSPTYNPKSYVNRYPQLGRYSAKQLILHFISIGRFYNLDAS